MPFKTAVNADPRNINVYVPVTPRETTHDSPVTVPFPEWYKGSAAFKESKETSMTWIAFEGMTVLEREYAEKSMMDGSIMTNHLWETLRNEYRVGEHFKTTEKHRMFIKRAYELVGEYFPSVTQEMIETHDDSKLDCLIEVLGYTDRWVWKIPSVTWQLALHHHYRQNPHHPEYFLVLGEKEAKQYSMERKYLEESVLDMLACEMAKKHEDKDDINAVDLITEFSLSYLKRYTPKDRERVLQYLDRIEKEEPVF